MCTEQREEEEEKNNQQQLLDNLKIHSVFSVNSFSLSHSFARIISFVSVYARLRNGLAILSRRSRFDCILNVSVHAHINGYTGHRVFNPNC